MLQYRIDELTRAHLSAGEEEALMARRDAAANAEKLKTAIHAARALLYDMDGSACERLTAAAAALDPASAHSAKLRQFGAYYEKAARELGVAFIDIGQVAAGGEVDDAGSLDEIEQRLAELRRIRKKYGGSISAAMELLESSVRERDEFEGMSQRVAAQAAEFERLALCLAERAEALTNARRAAADRLAAAVIYEMTFCGFMDEEVKAERQKLQEAIEESEAVKKLSEEEQKKHFKSIEAVFAELGWRDKRTEYSGNRESLYENQAETGNRSD